MRVDLVIDDDAGSVMRINAWQWSSPDVVVPAAGDWIDPASNERLAVFGSVHVERRVVSAHSVSLICRGLRREGEK